MLHCTCFIQVSCACARMRIIDFQSWRHHSVCRNCPVYTHGSCSGGNGRCPRNRIELHNNHSSRLIDCRQFHCFLSHPSTAVETVLFQAGDHGSASFVSFSIFGNCFNTSDWFPWVFSILLGSSWYRCHKHTHVLCRCGEMACSACHWTQQSSCSFLLIFWDPLLSWYLVWQSFSIDCGRIQSIGFLASIDWSTHRSLLMQHRTLDSGLLRILLRCFFLIFVSSLAVPWCLLTLWRMKVRYYCFYSLWSRDYDVMVVTWLEVITGCIQPTDGCVHLNAPVFHCHNFDYGVECHHRTISG